MSIADIAAAGLSPYTVASYLDETNWKQISTGRVDIAIYQRITANLQLDVGYYQVTVPLDRKLQDYDRRMIEAVETIARYEGVCKEQAVYEIFNYGRSRE